MNTLYTIPLVIAATGVLVHATTPKSSPTRAWSADIEKATKANSTFRTVLFTGTAMQLTLMSVAPGQDIGIEMHPATDQFLRVEAGSARVVMGSSKDKLDERHELTKDWAVIVPAGTWHNVINTSNEPLKLYSIYAPPAHPPNAVHRTKTDAEAAEASHAR